jgi:hypothetical protein
MRSGRDEPKWVVICMCMEAMLRISLYSFLYLKLAKTLCLLILTYVFSSTKSENKRSEQVLTRSGRRGGGECVKGEVALTMYSHVSKHKNHKKKNKQHLLSPNTHTLVDASGTYL